MRTDRATETAEVTGLSRKLNLINIDERMSPDGVKSVISVVDTKAGVFRRKSVVLASDAQQLPR